MYTLHEHKEVDKSDKSSIPAIIYWKREQINKSTEAHGNNSFWTITDHYYLDVESITAIIKNFASIHLFKVDSNPV